VAWGAGGPGQVGFAAYGQSVVPEPNTGFVAIAAGESHSLGLKAFPVPPRFHRGDPDASGATDITDAIHILGYLFLGETAPGCKESADADNDGAIDITDGIYLLRWLFAGGPEPPAPGPAGRPCGRDPDGAGSRGDLGCAEYPACPRGQR
jgi:hypothetical protein